jgi:hypothetical protein
MTIESKLPHWLLSEVYKQKAAATINGGWTVKKLREFLDATVQAREALQRTEKEYHPFPLRDNRSRMSGRFPGNRSIFQSGAYAVTTTQNRPFNSRTAERNSFNTERRDATQLQRRANTPNKPGCGFCSGNHIPDRCEAYKTEQQRFDRAIQLKACMKCLEVGHRAAECTARKSCLNCKGGHETAMCKNRSKFWRSAPKQTKILSISWYFLHK